MLFLTLPEQSRRLTRKAQVLGLTGETIWLVGGVFGTSWLLGLLGWLGLAGDVGAVWADLGQAGRSGTGEVWGCWVSLKLAGEVWGCLGSLELGGLIWNELRESGSGWGFGAVWASLKLAGKVGEWFEAGWDAGGALSELAGGLAGGRARLQGASWGAS